ncbi:nitroreductase [Gracilibacillus oryzae]|uniref:Putative NAD(P)H nitroreductase n=1 Tax=Gracilibacillus oryzae TaxID=1672701 RepID=A0A7C8GTU0_9BACI|nr:nitroreductase [Gracilibacillus oryzae]KAB8137676.1 nitroreductase [Gracilibacillus oryzae]
MDLKQLIKDRRSIAAYKEDAVSADLMKELLDVAVWVPNHKMTEPWRFVFVTDETKKKLAEINRDIAKEKAKNASEEELEQIGEIGYQKIMSVPFIIFVINQVNPIEKLIEEDYASASCLIQNFSLLAWEKGLSVFWKTGKLAFCEETADLIRLQDNERVIGLLQVGYPAKDQSPVMRIPATDRITELS